MLMTQWTVSTKFVAWFFLSSFPCAQNLGDWTTPWISWGKMLAESPKEVILKLIFLSFRQRALSPIQQGSGKSASPQKLKNEVFPIFGHKIGLCSHPLGLSTSLLYSCVSAVSVCFFPPEGFLRSLEKLRLQGRLGVLGINTPREANLFFFVGTVLKVWVLQFAQDFPWAEASIYPQWWRDWSCVQYVLSFFTGSCFLSDSCFLYLPYQLWTLHWFQGHFLGDPP